ncbi:hypothetical protein PsYK624_075920 [Phanerochaete sordida]|uniref:Uncharacterized protein n=1 Tax=Phanerochaete sordida TaxID=48140 RepID=A0A9P3GB82_9APHY|nr:hypothetical protein PsYK624_075920 [Phanerochaete sordida]
MNSNFEHVKLGGPGRTSAFSVISHAISGPAHRPRTNSVTLGTSFIHLASQPTGPLASNGACIASSMRFWLPPAAT